MYKSRSEQLQLENNAKWKLQERDDWRALTESLTQDRNRLKTELEEMSLKYDEITAELEDLKCSNNSRHSDNDTDSEVTSNPDDSVAEQPTESSRDSPAMKDQLRRNTAQNRHISTVVDTIPSSSSASSSPTKNHIGNGIRKTEKSFEQLYRDLQHEYQALQQQEKFHRLEVISLREQYTKVSEENHHLRYNEVGGYHKLPPGTFVNTAAVNPDESGGSGTDNANADLQAPKRALPTARSWFSFASGGAQQPLKKNSSNIILHV